MPGQDREHLVILPTTGRAHRRLIRFFYHTIYLTNLPLPCTIYHLPNLPSTIYHLPSICKKKIPKSHPSNFQTINASVSKFSPPLSPYEHVHDRQYVSSPAARTPTDVCTHTLATNTTGACTRPNDNTLDTYPRDRLPPGTSTYVCHFLWFNRGPFLCQERAIRVLSDRAFVISRRSSPALGTQDTLRHRGIVDAMKLTGKVIPAPWLPTGYLKLVVTQLWGS